MRLYLFLRVLLILPPEVGTGGFDRFKALYNAINSLGGGIIYALRIIIHRLDRFFGRLFRRIERRRGFFSRSFGGFPGFDFFLRQFPNGFDQPFFLRFILLYDFGVLFNGGIVLIFSLRCLGFDLCKSQPSIRVFFRPSGQWTVHSKIAKPRLPLTFGNIGKFFLKLCPGFLRSFLCSTGFDLKGI